MEFSKSKQLKQGSGKKSTLLKKQLDKLAREYVLLRDKSICQKCGKYLAKNANWSHVIPRARGLRLKWAPENAKILCTYCHKSFWHSSPVESGEWFRNKFPDRWKYLQEQCKRGVKKWRTSELEDFRDWYIRAIENYPQDVGKYIIE